jgi:hypothetical protein
MRILATLLAPSQLTPSALVTLRSLMRSMIISAKVLTESPLPDITIEDGDTALGPSESDAALVRERGRLGRAKSYNRARPMLQTMRWRSQRSLFDCDLDRCPRIRRSGPESPTTPQMVKSDARLH